MKKVTYQFDDQGRIVLDEFVIAELSLGAMRNLQKDGNLENNGDLQYKMAALCVTRGGQPVTEQELMEMGVRKGTRLLQAVAFINAGGDDEEGNG